MKKIIICIMGIISLLSLSLSAYAGNNMFIDDNFDEVLMLNHWVDDTGRGSKQIETDGSNNYLAMTASSSFFNFQAKDVRVIWKFNLDSQEIFQLQDLSWLDD